MKKTFAFFVFSFLMIGLIGILVASCATTTDTTTTTTTTVPFPGYYSVSGTIYQEPCTAETVGCALSTAQFGPNWWDNRVWMNMVTFSGGEGTYAATTTEAGTYWIAAQHDGPPSWSGVPGGLANMQSITFVANDPSSWSQTADFTMEATP
jgi:hypothetical protein